MLKQIKLIVLLIVVVAHSVVADTQILLWERDADIPGMQEYIALFAQLTEPEYGAFSLTLSAPMEQGRAVKEMVTGTLVNVAILGNEIERERLLLPIYFPLDKGLLGMRVCVVRGDEPDIFHKVRNIQDIRQQNLVIGSGSHWPDTNILLANNVAVSASPRYEGLLAMLARQRFDCLTRSLNEIEAELPKYREHNLQVDEHIALVYPLANMIYVSPAFPLLAERLKKGLALAIEQDKIDPIFNRHYGDVIDAKRFFQRRLMILENPNLSDAARETINEYGLMAFEQAKN